VEIGFQGPDPSTDLRGAGVLGLRNLYHYVLKSENSQFTWKIASDAKTWYFFSASGINFTGKIIDLIESGFYDEFLLTCQSEILDFSNKLYDVLFSSFNEYWYKNGFTDFMKFNTQLEYFMATQRHKFDHKSLFILENKFY
jgi:hypothetical protein